MWLTWWQTKIAELYPTFQHDIPSELRNHHTSSLLGEVPYTSVWPEIWVGQPDFANAAELISQVRCGDVTGPDWACGDCKETNPGNFDICWQCGQLTSSK